jgi:formate transporter
VANTYSISAGLVVKHWGPPDFWNLVGKTASDYPYLTWYNFLIVDFLLATLGNIIEGVLMVGFVYWFACRRKMPRGLSQKAKGESR